VPTILRGRIGIIIRALLSVGLIVALAYNIGSREILAHLKTVSLPSIAVATAIFAVSAFLVTPRWTIILSILGCRISWNALLGSVFVGILFNQVLPTAVGGDVLRAWRAKQLGATWETAIHSVLLDRATGVLIALLGAAMLLPFAGYRDGQTTLEWIVGAGVGLVVAALVVLWVLARFRSARLPFMAALQNGLVRFHENAWTFARKPGAAAIVFVLAGLNQLLPVAAIWIFAKELNTGLPILDAIFIASISTLVATIPISFAGWGIREGALVYLFGLYGVRPEVAFTISVLFGLSQTISAAPAAFLLLQAQSKPAPAPNSDIK
jgi:uncharacterized protein (TIRG00374 family)